MSVDYDKMSYVVASDYRMAIFKDLADGSATPSQIAERLPYHISHVSRSLQELRDRDLVELMVSEDVRKGRLYGLTEQGEEVVQEIEDGNGDKR